MLSKEEQQKCREILKGLGLDDLFSLAKTTSGGLVVVTSKQEALDVILKFSNSPGQLLGRQKLKRNVLINYLVNQGITECVNEEKVKLIRRVLTLWGVNRLVKVEHSVIEEEDDDDDVVLVEPQVPAAITQPQPQVPAAITQPGPQVPVVTTQPQPPAHNAPLQPPDNIGQNIAEKFVQWFYQILNSLHHLAQEENPDFGPQHFWDDCVFKVKCQTNNFFEENFNGSYLAFQRLAAFVQEEGLIFQPNTNGNGIRGFSEPHGLTVVMVCGSVHQENTCVGLFEQRFGLIQDPLMENNFRIKYTDLVLRNTQDTQTHHLMPNEKNFPVQNQQAITNN